MPPVDEIPPSRRDPPGRAGARARTEHVRTEHVGSLLRPPRLLDARRRLAAGTIDATELRQVEDETVIEALRAQESIGIDVVGDGELRRAEFRAGVAAAVSGLREELYEREWHGDDGEVAVQSRSWHVTGVVRRTAPIATDEASFVSRHTRAPFKVTLPAPGYIAERFHRPEDRPPYESAASLAAVFNEILREEIAELIELGVPYIQIDNPGYATFVDETARERLKAQGRSPDELFHAMLAADVELLAAIPEDCATIGLHVCRGNNSSHWLHQGGYGPIAEELFATLPVDRLLLEFDDERSGGLDVLRFVPRGKTAVLGLISTKTATIEAPDDLLRRLDEAARYVDGSQLAISPQCGFATHAEGGNHLTAEDQYRKLEVAVETARRWF